MAYRINSLVPVKTMLNLVNMVKTSQTALNLRHATGDIEEQQCIRLGLRDECQPISWTVLTSWPGKSRRSRQSRHSSSSSFISGGREQAVPGCLDEANDLRALYGGKADQEIVNGIAAFEVVHQILHRHPGTSENGRATHDFRIGVEDFSQMLFAHAENLTSLRREGKHLRKIKIRTRSG